MKFDLSYNEALKRHPKEVAAIAQTLRKSKSIHRDAKPETLNWCYRCAVRVQGFSFADVLAGRVRPKDTRTIDELVADEVSRTSTLLQATLGKWFGGESVPNPPEVAARARANFEERAREQAEYDAMPQVERDREVQEALKELSGQPGFTAIYIPKR